MPLWMNGVLLYVCIFVPTLCLTLVLALPGLGRLFIYERAVKCYKKEEYGKALYLFKKVYRRKKVMEPIILDYLAESYSKMGMKKEAIAVLEEESAEMPRSNILQLKIACMRYEDGDIEGYEEDVIKCCENYPNDAIALTHMAQIESRRDNHESAIKLLCKVLQIDSTNTTALSHLAVEYANACEYELALPIIDKAMLYGNEEAGRIKKRILDLQSNKYY